MNSTQQETASQPEVWRAALRLVPQASAALARPGECVLAIGCGTSLFVAELITVLRESAERRPRIDCWRHAAT